MSFRFKNILILLFITVLFIFYFSPSCAAFGPWDKTNSKTQTEDEFETSVPKITALSMIRFYQNFISPLLGKGKCNFTPSCSRYGYQAVKEYGALKGTVMAFERISRCHPWAWEEKYKVKDGHLYDPPTEN